MAKLLIVSNCPSDNTRQLQEAVAAGAKIPDIDNVRVTCRLPLVADSQDVLQADGIVIGTTENFGYMSGQIKDFFERIYYPCLEETQGKPAAIFVKGGLDGQGAKNSVEKIITGLRWKLVQPTLVLKGKFQPDFLTQCKDLGTYMAAGLDNQIF